MIPRPEDALRVTQRLLQARQELAKAEKEYKFFFGGSAPDSGAARSEPGLKGMEARLHMLLSANPDRAYVAEEAAKDLSANSNTVRTTLSRLVGKGFIEKRGYSQYGAKRTTSAHGASA